MRLVLLGCWWLDGEVVVEGVGDEMVRWLLVWFLITRCLTITLIYIE